MTEPQRKSSFDIATEDLLRQMEESARKQEEEKRKRVQDNVEFMKELGIELTDEEIAKESARPSRKAQPNAKS